jgi:hypothetical protein
MKRLSPGAWLVVVLIIFLLAGIVMGQGLQQSGGAPGTVTANQGGTWNVRAQDGSGTALTSTSSALDINIKSGSFVLPAGSALIGYVKQRPNGCTAAGTSDVVHDTVGVATGAGTSVSSVTGCVEECYLNNTTNSGVTLRLQTKDGTPIIWIGGNADFSVPANSNLGCGGAEGLNIAGITFTSGITAIAGTASALNLHIVTRE